MSLPYFLYVSARVYNHIASQLRTRRSNTVEVQRDQARRVFAITKHMFDNAVQWPERAAWIQKLKDQKSVKSSAQFIQASSNPATSAMEISRASLNLSLTSTLDVSSAEERAAAGGAAAGDDDEEGEDPLDPQFNVADYMKKESRSDDNQS